MKKYLCGLITAGFLTPVAMKKLSQCIAFVGVYMYKDSWPTFIADILALPWPNVVIEILDSISYALDETVVAKGIREHIKSCLKP
jgi:hypothetical protein